MRSEAKCFWKFSQCAQSQQGLSLLEILIAMAVVFLALMGFAGFSVVAHTGMSASQKMTRGGHVGAGKDGRHSAGGRAT